MVSATVAVKVIRRPAFLRRWNEFLEFARLHQPPQWIFRGQLQHWPLKPSVGRDDSYSASRELQLFNEFKRLARPLIDSSRSHDEWDWLFIAQHHGLPTRLLDWTTNPLVAAYFACQPSPKGKRQGEIIAVQVSDIGLLSEAQRDLGPFGIQETGFVYPSAVAARIASQRGLFSIHAEPSKNWILRNKTERFSIEASDKARFLGYLYGLGVDAAMVMADLDGLAKNLSWRYGSRRPIQ